MKVQNGLRRWSPVATGDLKGTRPFPDQCSPCILFDRLGFHSIVKGFKGQKVETTTFRLNSQAESFETFGVMRFIWDQNLKENGERNRMMKRKNLSCDTVG